MTARELSALNTRLEALRSKHAALSSRIEEAQRSLGTADYYLTQLKKQKLQVKEELEDVRRKVAN